MEELKVNTDNLTVLILAAGYGKRMGPFSRMVNKSLIPYGDKPLVSHIIDKFPKNTKFVIACGHLGQQVKDYVAHVHDDKNVIFVDIPNFSEGSTGPATTVQYCEKHLKNGFLLIACDTLFEFNWQDRLDHNWIGVYPVDSKLAKDYDWVERDGDEIVKLHNKEPSTKAVDAFIGLLYAKDSEFVNNLKKNKAKENIQGFTGMKFKAHTVREWLDFGTYEKWMELNGSMPENSFVKPDEIFYHDNNKVVKYFSKEESVNNRALRAKNNPKCMPTNIKAVGNFLIHDWTQGDILYNQLTPELFEKMLKWCEESVWIPHNTNINTYNACFNFYREKTFERLNQFRIKYSDWSECRIVNDQEVNSIDNYLNAINWDDLCYNTKWAFIHGDLHFDNTIYNPQTDKFTAIDWRTDFAGQVYGDVYYDLAKMLGGIWLNYRDVKNEFFNYYDNSDKATMVIPTVAYPDSYENILKKWVLKNNLDWLKVKTLVPIIYLNMSPLHTYPFDKFLIALAQYNFSKISCK